MHRLTQPLTIFLIGATGDLAKKRILKAAYNLYRKELLVDPFTLIGVARKEISVAEFQQYVKEIVQPKETAVWEKFAKCLYYVSGDAAEAETYHKIKVLHTQIASDRQCGNHMWYLATLPSLYRPIAQHLKQLQLHETTCGWTKLLIEKPFGTDLATAQQLNAELKSAFQEEQIYRIDHFLGKETVQNLLAFRFANDLFEHVWNRQYVDHIQITYADDLGLTDRGEFYDQTGATRDLVQNHLLQVISMTMMEEPASFSAQDIRASRSELLQSIKCFTCDGEPQVAFGQYTAGESDGKNVSGYVEEPGVAAGSETETAVALRFEIDNDRWRGVPIYIRTGKRLPRYVFELTLQFKTKNNSIFKEFQFGPDHNVLHLRFQPNEGIVLRLFVKKPGHGLELDMVPMEFCYRNQFQMEFIEAYERLIHDASTDDPTLFPNAEGVEAAWRVIDQVLEHKKGKSPDPYQAGTWGPASFEEIIERDGRVWIEPSVDVCNI